MPVAAVAGAVFAGAELVAGGLTIFQTIAAVGAITAGVGAVTGDQDLMKIGAIGSLAGGVGMFAENQGLLNTAQAAAEAGGNTAAMIGQEAVGVNDFAPVVDDGMGAVEAAGNVTGDTLVAADGGNIAQGITDTTGVTQSPTMNTQPGGLLNASPSNPMDMKLAAGKVGEAAKDTSVFINTSPSNPMDMKLAAGKVVGEAAKDTSVFSSLQKFADLLKNKDGTYDKNLLAIGANFVGGFFDDKKKAETDYYRSRTASEDAQRTNANSVPSLAGLKVSDKNIFPTNASTYTPVRVGLINAR